MPWISFTRNGQPLESAINTLADGTLVALADDPAVPAAVRRAARKEHDARRAATAMSFDHRAAGGRAPHNVLLSDVMRRRRAARIAENPRMYR